MSGKHHLREEVFKEIAKGNEIAFREVYDAFRAPFYSTALKMTHSSDLAEELVQDVFVVIWEKRKLIGDAHNPKGYIFRILHNQISSYFRSVVLEKQRLNKYASSLEIVKEESEVDVISDEEIEKKLYKAIDKLPVKQKTVFRLARIEGISRKEIAEILEISPNTVRNHLAAAQINIREYFANTLWTIIWIIISLK
ncbi:RNA polymerase sigma factor [Formosa sp. S-31]|uniref:RNA polymerase sigma factor n=1 Tax=Formosa sp. S-31 TaxID=2790949 RepID=UPI003EBC6459